jgi:hypothetical protein
MASVMPFESKRWVYYHVIGSKIDEVVRKRLGREERADVGLRSLNRAAYAGTRCDRYVINRGNRS